MATATKEEIDSALDEFYETCDGLSWRHYGPVRLAFARAAMKKKIIAQKKAMQRKGSEEGATTLRRDGEREPDNENGVDRRRSHSRSRSVGRERRNSRSRSRSRSLLRAHHISGSSSSSSSRSPQLRSRSRRIINMSTSPSSSSPDSLPILRSRSRRHIITLSSSSSSRSPSPLHIDLTQRSNPSAEAPATKRARLGHTDQNGLLTNLDHSTYFITNLDHFSYPTHHC